MSHPKRNLKECRERAIAELQKRGLPVQYILDLTAFLANPSKALPPVPFEGFTLRHTGRPMPKGGLSQKTMFDPICTAGQVRKMPPDTLYTCPTHKISLVLKGRGIQGWVYVCLEPSCSYARTKKASKDDLGLARGTRRRTIHEEMQARYIAAIRCLSNPPYPWEAIGDLMISERIIPHTEDPIDVAENLARLARHNRNLFGPYFIQQIRLEAHHWTSHI